MTGGRASLSKSLSPTSTSRRAGLARFPRSSTDQTALCKSDLLINTITNSQNVPLRQPKGWDFLTGQRSSAYRAYIPASFVNTKGERLHIFCTKVVAFKLEFSHADGGNLRAQNVVIQTTGGSYSRKLLLPSNGIGLEDHLKEMGVEVLKHSPGVGENRVRPIITGPCTYVDYHAARSPPGCNMLSLELCKNLRYGAGWFVGTMAEGEIFGLSSLVSADGKPHALPKEHEDPSDPNSLPGFAVERLFDLKSALLLSKSRGRLRLRSTNPNDDPDCDMKHLTSPADYVALRSALRVTEQHANEMRVIGCHLENVHVPQSHDDAELDIISERL
ncbi:hypothetical protein EW146_g7924 [Bondarzewia mesenterica]|uniref:Glucose-methanol-choline oxidoreductase C-terminal domain-containing protein n=1 Tax=Bondarzewia mesenterica TaxID=1095465 RepID=A0A4S4LIA3_9AGAM|nr:hypothetical protein EW146_g7924 [Bondarzewia mesenterica]